MSFPKLRVGCSSHPGVATPDHIKQARPDHRSVGPANTERPDRGDLRRHHMNASAARLLTCNVADVGRCATWPRHGRRSALTPTTQRTRIGPGIPRQRTLTGRPDTTPLRAEVT